MTAAARRLADDTYRAAEAARLRALPSAGLTFRSVRHALQWHAETRDRIASGAGVHPRGQRARDGTTVVVSVDGGQAVSRDEVLATLHTIHAAIEGAAGAYPDGTRWLVRRIHGEAERDIADSVGKSQQAVSAAIGRVESYLRGALDAGKVLR